MIFSSHTIVDDHAENNQFISSLYRLAWRWKLHRLSTDATSSEDSLFRLLAVEFKIVRNCPILDVLKFISAITGIHCWYNQVPSANFMMSLSAKSGRKSAALTKRCTGLPVGLLMCGCGILNSYLYTIHSLIWCRQSQLLTRRPKDIF